MRRAKNYVKIWVTAEFLADFGHVLKSKRILKTDPIIDCYLVECRKFKIPRGQYLHGRA